MNVNTCAMLAWKFASTRSVTSTLVVTRAKTGVWRADSRAKTRGKTPSRAIAKGSSPWSRIQPFKAPYALMAAKRATSVAEPSPQKIRAASAKGAFEAASCAPGTRSSTVQQATVQTRAVTTVPSIVARGMVRAGSSTLSAGTVADSKPSSAQSARVAAAVIPSSVSGASANDASVSLRT